MSGGEAHAAAAGAAAAGPPEVSSSTEGSDTRTPPGVTTPGSAARRSTSKASPPAPPRAFRSRPFSTRSLNHVRRESLQSSRSLRQAPWARRCASTAPRPDTSRRACRAARGLGGCGDGRYGGYGP